MTVTKNYHNMEMLWSRRGEHLGFIYLMFGLTDIKPQEKRFHTHPHKMWTIVIQTVKRNYNYMGTRIDRCGCLGKTKHIELIRVKSIRKIERLSGEKNSVYSHESMWP